PATRLIRSTFNYMKESHQDGPTSADVTTRADVPSADTATAAPAKSANAKGRGRTLRTPFRRRRGDAAEAQTSIEGAVQPDAAAQEVPAAPKPSSRAPKTAKGRSPRARTQAGQGAEKRTGQANPGGEKEVEKALAYLDGAARMEQRL